MKKNTRRLVVLTLCLVWPVLAATAGNAQPDFSKVFLPDTIGPGSVSTLRFDIQNGDQFPVEDLEFTDNLPAGITVATPANAWSDCLGSIGTLSALEGGTTVSLSSGELGPEASCSVLVDVTSATPGTHMNVSGDLTSLAGNSGPAMADLVVDIARPGFTKSFSPNPIVPGDTSTLTFTIDNTLNEGGAANFLQFTDNLPNNLVIAAPANASSNCVAAGLIAVPGTGTILLFSGSVAATQSCTVSVDVTALTAGPKENTTGELTFVVQFDPVSAGKAGATLEVEKKFLIKVFTDDPTPPGGTVDLEFTLTNFNRLHDATDISFTDDLDAALSGLEAIGLPLADPCGPGSLLSGTSDIALTGGNLAPEANCTFGATLQVSPGAAPGTYVNVTSSVVTVVDDEVVVEDSATDDLVVAPVPLLNKSFVDDPVTGGDAVTLRFEVTNSSPTSTATDITFEDVLIDGLPTASGTPGPDPCGPGSTVTFTPLSNPLPPNETIPASITLTGGTLAASASCTFDVILDVDETIAGGAYLNTTSPIMATVDAETLTGNPATDTLDIVTAPRLIKEFIDDPVLPGATATLEFTLLLGPEAPGGVTEITFTDDLSAALAGLEAVGLPTNGVCGAGSQVSGTSLLSFTGGSLSPGTSCTFSVTLLTPGDALPGNYTNTTSTVDGMSLGLAVDSAPASADLEIGGLTFTKKFTDDPALAGDTVTLEFTIDNLSPTADATGMIFTDNLDDTLDGLVALGLPIVDPCGDGSQLAGAAGNSLLVFTGGNLQPGMSCPFDVTLQIPPAAEPGDYPNATSQLSGNIGGSPVLLNPAVDVLTILEPLSLAKEFIGDPVLPGEQVTLEFTITNSASVDAATGISFTDDLDVGLANLAATGLPLNDICGAGSQISGTSLLTFTGGSLGPDSSCTFEVTLDVPASAQLGTTVTNTTSEVTGMVAGLQTSAPPAIDGLEIGEVICLALDGENLTLADDTVTDTQFFEVCDTLELGPNFEVVGPNGDLRIRAGRRVVFLNGTAIEGSGKMRAGTDPGLQP